jgi:hypothetical protein
MPSYAILYSVTLVRMDVSEERSAYIYILFVPNVGRLLVTANVPISPILVSPIMEGTFLRNVLLTRTTSCNLPKDKSSCLFLTNEAPHHGEARRCGVTTFASRPVPSRSDMQAVPNRQASSPGRRQLPSSGRTRRIVQSVSLLTISTGHPGPSPTNSSPYKGQQRSVSVDVLCAR